MKGRETPTLLGPLERANLQWLMLALSKGPNRVGVSFHSPNDGNISSISDAVFLVFRIPDTEQSPELQ
jgi:hypothetical protein